MLLTHVKDTYEEPECNVLSTLASEAFVKLLNWFRPVFLSILVYPSETRRGKDECCLCYTTHGDALCSEKGNG